MLSDGGNKGDFNMEENISIEQYMPKEKLWAWLPAKSEELVDGYKLHIDEDGDFNPNIYEAMVAKCQSGLFEIKDCRPDYFELVKKSDETLAQEKASQKANQIRSIRSQYMAEILNKIDRYEKQVSGGIETTDSEETYKQYLIYLQYLRDVPQSENFPDIEVLTFEKWTIGATGLRTTDDSNGE